MSAPPSAADTVRALLDALDEGDDEKAAALVADDFRATAHIDGSTIDRAAYLHAHQGLRDSFPDLRHHVLELTELAPGRVRGVAYITATNDRPVRLPDAGIDLPKPTGRVLRTVPHTDEFVVRDGQVAGYTSSQPPGAGLRGLLDQIREMTDG